MCLATVYIEDKKMGNELEVVMEKTQAIDVNDDGTITCCNLFGEVRTIAGSIKSIDFDRSKVYLHVRP